MRFCAGHPHHGPHLHVWHPAGGDGGGSGCGNADDDEVSH